MDLKELIERWKERRSKAYIGHSEHIDEILDWDYDEENHVETIIFKCRKDGKLRKFTYHPSEGVKITIISSK